MYQVNYSRYVPFLRFAIPFGIGIWWAWSTTFSGYLPALVAFLLLFLLLSGFIVFSGMHRKYKFRWVVGALFSSLLFFFGMLLTWHVLPSVISGEVQLNAKVLVKDQDFTSGGYNRLTVLPLQIGARDTIPFKRGDLWQIITDKPDSTGLSSIQPGDTLVFDAKLSGPKPAANPNTFDYGKYLFRSGVAASAFVPGDATKVIEGTKPGGISGLLNTMRSGAQDIYKRQGIEGNELNVLSALTLGMREDIDTELRQRFIRSGAVHILAVSGLHVGIVFLLLNSFLSLFLKPQSPLKLILVLCGLWFFALLTGGAPSVFRAVIMFSVIQTGHFSNRQSNIFNLLGISAFLILMINPLSLFNAGFWLSHLAVAGIVVLFPIFSGWGVYLPVFLRWLWDLISVSLAAQIATFPLSVLLFKAFPVYFLLTNVLVLPLVTPIILLALLLLVTAAFPFASRIVAGALEDVLQFLNDTVLWLDTLPGAYYEQLWISWPMMLAIYLGIASLIVFTELKNRHFFKLALLSGLLIMVMANVQYLTKRFSNSFIVFDAGRANIVGNVFAGEGYYWSSGDVTQKTLNFVTGGFFTRHSFSVRPYNAFFNDTIPTDKSLVVFPVKDGSFLGIKSANIDQLAINQSLSLLGMVLLDKVEGDVNQLMQTASCKLLIVSSACPRWWVKKWKDSWLAAGLQVYDVSEEGAFLHKFQ